MLLAFPNAVPESLLTILNTICEGRAPRWLADAKLFELPKKAEGIRPIAVIEVLRRLAAATLVRSSLGALPPIPRQFVLRRDGCLTMAWLTSSTLALRNYYCALTVDLRNAFNCVSRSSVLSAASGTPLSKYAQWAYGSHSLLHFGYLNVTSSFGVQ